MTDKNYSTFLDLETQRLHVTLIVLFSALIFIAPQISQATTENVWLSHPVNNNWNNSANWSLRQVPKADNNAVFDVSTEINISVTQSVTQITGIVFNATASPYTITCLGGQSVAIFPHNKAQGILNYSGLTQTLIAGSDSAGEGGAFNLIDGTVSQLVTFITEAAKLPGGIPGSMAFTDFSEAGQANLINQGAATAGCAGGETDFFGTSAAEATITNRAATVSGAQGGLTVMHVGGDAGNAAVTCEGATLSGAAGGRIIFQKKASASSAHLSALGGTKGGEGGSLQFLFLPMEEWRPLKFPAMATST